MIEATLEGIDLEPTDQAGVFIWHGGEAMVVTVRGDSVLCREGDRVRLIKGLHDWLEVESVIRAPLH